MLTNSDLNKIQLLITDGLRPVVTEIKGLQEGIGGLKKGIFGVKGKH